MHMSNPICSSNCLIWFARQRILSLGISGLYNRNDTSTEIIIHVHSICNHNRHHFRGEYLYLFSFKQCGDEFYSHIYILCKYFINIMKMQQLNS